MASPSAFPQRPRVFLTRAWVCARRWFGYPAVRVRCEEGDRGASASVDATKLDPHLVLYLQPTCTNFTSWWSRPI
jgi:hypothetical protein